MTYNYSSTVWGPYLLEGRAALTVQDYKLCCLQKRVKCFSAATTTHPTFIWTSTIILLANITDRSLKKNISCRDSRKRRYYSAQGPATFSRSVGHTAYTRTLALCLSLWHIFINNDTASARKNGKPPDWPQSSYENDNVVVRKLSVIGKLLKLLASCKNSWIQRKSSAN